MGGKAALIACFLAFLFMSCSKGDLNRTTTGISVTKSGMAVRMSMQGAPSDVATIVGILSRPGYDTLSHAFTISGDSATCLFTGLDAGTWHLEVNAYDGANNLLYTGSADVQVVAGQTTPVSLTLNPATGSISVHITWGGTDTTSTDMALLFGGVNGEVDFAPSPTLQLQKMTIELKVQFDTISIFEPILLDRVSNSWNQASGFHITYEKGYLYFDLAQSPIYRAGATYAFTPTLHKWTDIAYSYDGESIKMYVDGVLVNQLEYDTPVYYSDSIKTCLGYGYNSYYGGGPFYFKGAIDNLQIWNRALTRDEIDSTMNSHLTGHESGLVGYWDFNQTSSDRVALDHTGNNDNGQLSGDVSFVPAATLYP